MLLLLSCVKVTASGWLNWSELASGSPQRMGRRRRCRRDGGQPTAMRIHAVGQLIRLAGVKLISAVLVDANKNDESLGELGSISRSRLGSGLIPAVGRTSSDLEAVADVGQPRVLRLVAVVFRPGEHREDAHTAGLLVAAGQLRGQFRTERAQVPALDRDTAGPAEGGGGHRGGGTVVGEVMLDHELVAPVVQPDVLGRQALVALVACMSSVKEE